MSVYSDRVGSRPSSTGRTAAYAAVGAAVGGIWALGGDTPAWEHALRVLVVVLCVSVAGRFLGRRLARTGRAPVDRRLFFGLVAGKVLLVAVALLVDQLAGLWFAEPALLTAGFLFVLVTVAGPVLHDRLAHGAGTGAGAEAGRTGIRRGGTPEGEAAA
ncbi:MULTISPECIES: hypothetical protein [unclassified Streptomyces]|uniref:hypothetical protein n=1 Tax=unclassified Streptomyces TaxID=2593676 RepID=UPI0004BD5E9B|nr:MULTISPECIES: hypothetical protein [unclassified Streptomyces]